MILYDRLSNSVGNVEEVAMVNKELVKELGEKLPDKDCTCPVRRPAGNVHFIGCPVFNEGAE